MCYEQEIVSGSLYEKFESRLGFVILHERPSAHPRERNGDGQKTFVGVRNAPVQIGGLHREHPQLLMLLTHILPS